MTGHEANLSINAVLVIDDERTFPELRGARYARTVAEAIDALSEDVRWSEVWWDHDLGDGQDSMQIVAWMDAAQAQYRDDESRWIGEMMQPRPLFFRRRPDPQPPRLAYRCGQHFVHTMNPVGAARLVAALRWHSTSVQRVTLPEVAHA